MRTEIDSSLCQWRKNWDFIIVVAFLAVDIKTTGNWDIHNNRKGYLFVTDKFSLGLVIWESWNEIQFLQLMPEKCLRREKIAHNGSSVLDA